MGTVVLDVGAVKALNNGKSLLPSGILKIDGSFEYGDPVQIEDINHKIIAVGLSRYHANEARHIMGRNSTEISGILGYSRGDVIIHRDDLVLQA